MPVTACVLHYTAAGSASGSVAWLTNSAAGASAHFVISRHGDIRQLVDLEHASWHAGVAEAEHRGEVIGDVNLWTIGIELANCGMLQRLNGSYYYEVGRKLKRYRREPPVYASLDYDNGHKIEGYWEPYRDAQIDALQELLLKLKGAGYQEAVENLLGHEEVAMPLGRKMDPGPLFPWHRFWRKHDQRTRAHLLEPPDSERSA